MMDKLRELHPLFLAIGAALGAYGLSPAMVSGSRSQAIVIALGGALGTFGGVLARKWQPKDGDE